MADKQGVIVITYRDRPTHLDCLLMTLQKHFSYIPVVVVEQADTKTWNKGMLFNTAYQEVGKDYDYMILHDVDFIPVPGAVDYSFCEQPTMVAGAASQFNYKLYYPTFFGGVVICSNEHFELANGFSNQFRGYGGEDDSFRNSFIQKGLKPQVKMGRFECFAHPKPNIWPGSDFYKSAEYQHNLKLATQARNFVDGLDNYKDYMESCTIEKTYYTHIKVITK